MQMLIDAGAGVDARSTIVTWARQRTDEPRDKWLPPGGWTPLLLAARENCVACVDVLAAAGADLNIVNPQRHTALIVALVNGHFDVAGRLFDHGADVNMQGEVGQTPLWAAVDAHTMPGSNRPPPTEMNDELSAWASSRSWWREGPTWTSGVPLPDAAELNASFASASQPAGDTWDDDPDD